MCNLCRRLLKTNYLNLNLNIDPVSVLNLLILQAIVIV